MTISNIVGLYTLSLNRHFLFQVPLLSIQKMEIKEVVKNIHVNIDKLDGHKENTK